MDTIESSKMGFIVEGTGAVWIIVGMTLLLWTQPLNFHVVTCFMNLDLVAASGRLITIYISYIQRFPFKVTK